MDKASWTIFGLVEQEKIKPSIVAEKLGITIQEVKDVMSNIRAEHPDLFYIDSERMYLSRQIGGQEQNRRNTYMTSYDARKSKADNVDEEIKQKF